MSVSKRELATTLYYPETDGKPMGETDFHIKLIVDISEALRNFFMRQPDVYVSRDLLLYYEPGNTRKFVVPDVFVVRGVSKGDRRVYKLWEEGRPPNVVIEISSRETKKADLNSKFGLYERIGIAEYYVFDPEYRYVKPPLRASKPKPAPSFLPPGCANWALTRIDFELGLRQTPFICPCHRYSRQNVVGEYEPFSTSCANRGGRR